MQPLPVPNRRFGSYSMDWITGLPPSGPLHYNAIYTVVNRTTQGIRLTPCVLGAGKMSVEATAMLFFDGIVRHYGLPDEVLHDMTETHVSLLS